MTKLASLFTTSLSALVIAFSMAALFAQPAVAQSAKKLKCSGCVKSKQLKDNGILSKDIGNGQVMNPDLADNAVDSGKIADGSVGNSDLADNAVDSGKIAANAVIESAIATGAVSQRAIATDAVGSDEIGVNSVFGSEVAPNSIPHTDLSNEAGVEYAGGVQFLDLALDVDTVVRSILVTAPSAGNVILYASGTFGFAANASAQCSLTTGKALESIDRQIAGGVNDAHNQFFGMTEGFAVAAGSLNTFNLVCRETAEGVTIEDSDLTAVFSASRY